MPDKRTTHFRQADEDEIRKIILVNNTVLKDKLRKKRKLERQRKKVNR